MGHPPEAIDRVNRLLLSAQIVQVNPLRYTPAGLPALDLVLEHESEQLDNGHLRQVKVSVKALAFGTWAETLAKASLEDRWTFSGFLGMSRNGKGVVFHIQDSHRS